MKTFTKFLLGCFALVIMTSCGEDKVTFSFTYQCSEDLLDFVIPSATFKNANGNVCVIELDKSKLSKVDQSDLVGTNNPVMYTWKHNVVIKGQSSGVQRDMIINYKMRNDAPAIMNDKEYGMVHKLDCAATQERSAGWFDSSSVSVDSSTEIEIIIGSSSQIYIQGNQLQTYLNNLIENPDYVKKEV